MLLFGWIFKLMLNRYSVIWTQPSGPLCLWQCYSHNWSSEHHSPQCHIRICGKHSGATLPFALSFSGFSTRRKLISFGRASIYWWFSLWQRHARHSSSSKTGRYSPRKHLLTLLHCLFLELTVQLFLTSIPFVVRLSRQRILPQQAISAHSTLF